MTFDTKHIIKGCINNDRKCQEVLYKQYFGKMMSMCMRYAKDETEAMTILNDGFLRVFKKIHTFQFKGSFEGWVRRLVFHSLSDHFRKKAKDIKFLVLENQDRTGHAEALNHLYEEDILQLIEQVPPTSADVFVLNCIHGYTHKEIAGMKNISEGTSKWHLSNARKVLQNLIQKQRSNFRHG